MNKNTHQPILLDKIIELIVNKSDGVYVDCTLGWGGHSLSILNNIDQKGKLFSIDQDPKAIEFCKKMFKGRENIKIIKNNFVNIKAILSLHNVFKIDGILYDLGVSSPQLDDPKRGFSYRYDAPLDMRMDNTQTLDAKFVLNNKSIKELTDIIKLYGEEKFAYRISQNIDEFRKKKPLETTFELVEIIKKSLPEKVKRQKKHPAKKTFQAIRIYVNDEINILKNSIEQAISLLNIGGRICILTFHSLEEKIVNEIFNRLTFDKNQDINKYLPINIKSDVLFKKITKKPIFATNEEIFSNNRSHSAKLWVMERIGYE
ncbi:16S rRNA (cytosine(1402)-N(4))-methyltransferase RsmH [Spiroplasma endosymbiont of Aspidapion aeneum]|uniref:16S rRNA (cytosine(1402)-N(4))-methyltransferase RsmH n=1 Tax=Spiroplasma endosymbiont of Aspidapion aeneum TaxID=3066276 RepID=UPI00313A923A